MFRLFWWIIELFIYRECQEVVYLKLLVCVYLYILFLLFIVVFYGFLLFNIKTFTFSIIVEENNIISKRLDFYESFFFPSHLKRYDTKKITIHPNYICFFKYGNKELDKYNLTKNKRYQGIFLFWNDYRYYNFIKSLGNRERKKRIFRKII